MRKRGVVVAAVTVLAVLAAGFVFVRDGRIEAGRCAVVAELSAATTEPIGDGAAITVVGDSYSQGFGLDDPRESWVSFLPDAAVTVHAASGSGFTRGGLCDGATITELAVASTGPVIIQAGINDVGSNLNELAAAVDAALSAADVVALVGPALAPNLEPDAIRAVDEVLQRQANTHNVEYLSAVDWDLEFSDGIHLTAVGHHAFADMVAARL